MKNFLIKSSIVTTIFLLVINCVPRKELPDFYYQFLLQNYNIKYQGYSFYEVRKGYYKLKAPPDTVIIYSIKNGKAEIESVQVNNIYQSDTIKTDEYLIQKIIDKHSEFMSEGFFLIDSKKFRFEICFDLDSFSKKSLPKYQYNQKLENIICLCNIEDDYMNDERNRLFLKSKSPLSLGNGWYYFVEERPKIQ